ncbi:MAG: ATP-binding protein [Verrucomicrobia bacterium]|nr:ATP-binding protein [Verrucomicrobiota bacterium]
MEIKRDLYLDRLIQRKHNGLVKIITGIRRCGKSYLLRKLFKDHLLAQGVTSDHIIEMAFDIFENEKYQDPNVFNPWANSRIVDDKMHYFLLDEVQLLKKFEFVLNGLAYKPNTDVYVTGSNAKFLSKDIITEFGGRGDDIHIYPLSFREFMSAYDGSPYDGWKEYMLYGGLPTVVLEKNSEQKVNILNHLLKETYLSDILKRNKLKNIGEMEELMSILASSIGSLTNPNKLQKTFKSVKHSRITSSTITKYLNCLEDSFLIESAKRYDIKGKNYIETPLKYYYTDLGLRNAQINFRQLEVPHSMENIIYNTLKIRQFNVDVGIVPVNQRNEKNIPIRKQLEVDFVCNKASKRYYIQSAYLLPDEEKTEKEARSLRQISDSFKKIIITTDSPAPHYNEEGILILNIYDFLLKPEIIDF